MVRAITTKGKQQKLIGIQIPEKGLEQLLEAGRRRAAEHAQEL